MTIKTIPRIRAKSGGNIEPIAHPIAIQPMIAKTTILQILTSVILFISGYIKLLLKETKKTKESLCYFIKHFNKTSIINLFVGNSQGIKSIPSFIFNKVFFYGILMVTTVNFHYQTILLDIKIHNPMKWFKKSFLKNKLDLSVFQELLKDKFLFCGLFLQGKSKDSIAYLS